MSHNRTALIRRKNLKGYGDTSRIGSVSPVLPLTVDKKCGEKDHQLCMFKKEVIKRSY